MTTEAVVGGKGPQVQGCLEAPDAEAGGTLPQSLWREHPAYTLISDFCPKVGGNPFVVYGHSGHRTLAQPRTRANEWWFLCLLSSMRLQMTNPRPSRVPVLKGRSSVDNVLLLLPTHLLEVTQSTLENTPRPALRWSRALVRAATQGLPERASPWSCLEAESPRRGLAGEAGWVGFVLRGLSSGLWQDPNSLLWAQRRGSVRRHVATGLCSGPFSPLPLVSLVWPGVEVASRGCGTQVGQGDGSRATPGISPRCRWGRGRSGHCGHAPRIAMARELLSGPSPGSRQAGLPLHWVLGPRLPLFPGWGAPSEEAKQQPPTPPPPEEVCAEKQHQHTDPGPEDGLGCPGWGRASCGRGRATLSVPRTPASQLR